jgi:hypothetical protein
MNNPFIVQSIGLLVSAIGVLALISFTTIFGRPLSDEEKLRVGEKKRDLYRLPVNIETIISTIILVAGIGILKWANFDPCSFIAYWLPDLPRTVMVALHCN